MLRTAPSLPNGAFDAGHSPDATNLLRASWQLPGPGLHPAGNDELATKDQLNGSPSTA